MANYPALSFSLPDAFDIQLKVVQIVTEIQQHCVRDILSF